MPAEGKKVAILQSDYIPWKGYFDIIRKADEFIIYDDAQYTRRDWRNRNLIKTRDGINWLTIPVEVKNKYKQKIRETKVSGNKWTGRHRKILNHAYSGAAHYKEIDEWLSDILRRSEKEVFLSDINLMFISEIAGYLGIKTKISSSSDYIIEGGRSGKAMNICLQSGAGTYLSGPAAKSYLDIDAFSKAGISVEWMDYSDYKEYPQLYPPFIHQVSIIDLLFNTGCKAPEYLKELK
jgi:hypothetical protein